MKKQILSFFLSVVMIITLLPVGAFAAEPDTNAAQPMVIGSEFAVDIAAASRVTYSFTPQTLTKYRLEKVAAVGDLQVELYNENLERISEFSPTMGMSYYQDYVLGAGHTYYFVFSSCIFEESSSGTFLFSEIASEPLSLGAWTDVIIDGYDNKLFTYTPSESGTYQYRVSDNSTSLAVYDSNGNVVKFADYLFSQLTLSLQAGEKYLFECGQQGGVTAYSFKLEKMNETAINLDSPAAYSGDDENPPLFSFTPDHDGLYRFFVSEQQDYPRVTLYNSDFEEVAATFAYPGSREHIDYQLSAGATCYVMIKGESEYSSGQVYSGTIEVTELETINITFDANRTDAWFEDTQEQTRQQAMAGGTIISAYSVQAPLTSSSDVYFVGWSIYSDAQEAEAEIIAETDITIHAVWKPYYKVTFHTDAAGTYFGDMDYDYGNTYQRNYRQGDEFYRDDVPLQNTNSSIQFVGWKTDPDNEEYFVTGEDGGQITCDMDLYAIWKTLYQITFHANDDDAYFEHIGYDEDMNEIIYKETESFGLFPEDSVIDKTAAYNNLKTDNTKKIFAGWALAADATEPEEITVKGNVDVFAVWADAVTVTFHANHPNAYFWEQYMEGEETFDRQVPSIERKYAAGALIENTMEQLFIDNGEYSFLGWSEDENAATPDSDIYAAEGMNLYAVWQRSGYDPGTGEIEAWGEGLEFDPEAGGIGAYVVSVQPGEDATLTVGVNSDSLNPVSYAWYYGDYQVDSPTNTNTLTVRDINKSSMIQCYVTNGSGEAYVYIEIRVDNEFRAWPEGADIDPETGLHETRIKKGVSSGEIVNLVTKVQGSDLNGLTYSWATDTDPFETGEAWEPIQGADTDTYTITVDGKKHIRCVITDKFGNTTAIFFLYYIENNFAATAKVESQTVKPHESATFEVEATATDKTKMSYQWYRWDRAPLLSDYTEIPGETGTTLTLTDMVYSDIIYCKVDDGFGNMEMVRFYVSIDNELHAWPEGAKLKEEAGLHYRYLRVMVPYGGTADLTTLISGVDTNGVTYDWFLVDVEKWNYYRGIIADPQSTWAMDLMGMTQIEGATQNTYTTESIADAHQYICRVSDAYNSGDLVVFDVEVENGLKAWPEGAEFDEASQTYANRIDIYAKPGDTVTLKTNATATDTTDLRYHWYRCYEHEYYKYNYLLEDLNCFEDRLDWAFSENVMLCCDVTDCYGGQRKAFFNITEEASPACIVTVTSAGDGISSTIAPVYGGGEYHKGDSVTVGATNVSGFTFLGWYVNETQVSTDLEYTFTVEGDIDLVAVYQANTTTTYTLKITGYDFKVNGIPQNSTFTERFEAGTQVSLEYFGNDTFLRWENTANQPQSTEAALTLTMNRNYELTVITVHEYAGSEESGYYAFVEFVSPYDQVMSASVWSSTDSATEKTLPGGATKSGYSFAGWTMDGVNAAGARDIINAIDADTSYIKLTALLEEMDAPKTITIYDANGNTTEQTVNLGKNVSLKAGKVSGKTFKCWALDPEGNNPLSYNASYTFKVTADISVYAIYVNAGESVTPQPVVNTTGVYAETKGTGDYLFFMENHDVPSGYTVVEYGILYGTKVSEFPDAATAEAKLFYDSENPYVKKATSIYKLSRDSFDLQFIVTGHRDNYVYTRSYLVVTNDATGEQEIYYGQFRYGTYNSVSGTAG